MGAPGSRNPSLVVSYRGYGSFSLERLGTVTRNCPLCLERICHRLSDSLASRPQNRGAKRLWRLGPRDYLVLSAEDKIAVRSARINVAIFHSSGNRVYQDLARVDEPVAPWKHLNVKPGLSLIR